MLPNFLQLLARRATVADYEAAFVRKVQVAHRPPRSREIERMLIFGWLLIVLKSAWVWWACARYDMPFHPLWVILPTVAFAVLCTVVYCWRR